MVGLRPSPGLVANDARPLGWSVISVLGPMARDVGDTALMLSASVGFDARDPLSHPTPAPTRSGRCGETDLSRLRVGTTEDFGLCAGGARDPPRVPPIAWTRFARWVARCEPVDLALGDADRAFDVLRAESFVAAFADTYRTAPETLGPNVRANVEMAAAITLADRAWAHLEQTRIARSFAAAFERYDLILAPITPVSPFPWTELFAGRVDGQAMRNYYQWLGADLRGHAGHQPGPVAALRARRTGMPFGLQLVGRLRGDAELLSAARALEQAFDTAQRAAPPAPGPVGPAHASAGAEEHRDASATRARRRRGRCLHGRLIPLRVQRLSKSRERQAIRGP